MLYIPIHGINSDLEAKLPKILKNGTVSQSQWLLLPNCFLPKQSFIYSMYELTMQPLGLMDDKIRAIKGLVVCNVWDVSALGPIERSLLLSAVLRGKIIKKIFTLCLLTTWSC